MQPFFKLFYILCMVCIMVASMPVFNQAASNSGQGIKPVSRSAADGQKKPYHGNFKTMKYHNEFCDHYNCRTCTTIFKTKAAAEKAGYVPCGKCGG